MSLHPDYPEVVKVALAADLYWQHDYELSPQSFLAKDIGEEFSLTRRDIGLMRNEDAATRVGNIVRSMEGGGTIEQVPDGEQIPPLNSRQVVKIVEDSRRIAGRLSLHLMIMGTLNGLASRAAAKQVARTGNPDYSWPTFEENLEEMYASDLPSGYPAEAVVRYSTTRVAEIMRQVVYARMDESSGLFMCLPSMWLRSETHTRPILALIPNVKVGDVYSKDRADGLGHLGKIVSAEIVEPTSFVWDDKPGNSRTKTKKHTRVLRGLASDGIKGSIPTV